MSRSVRIPLKRRNDPEEGGGGDTVTSASYAREMLDDLLKLTQGGEGYARVHACLRVCAAVCECMHACMQAGSCMNACMCTSYLLCSLAVSFPASFSPYRPKALAHSRHLARQQIYRDRYVGWHRVRADQNALPQRAALALVCICMHACIHAPAQRAALARACLLCLSVCQTPPPHRTKHQNQPQRRTASTWVFLHYDCVRVCAQERESARAHTHTHAHTHTRTHTHTHTPHRCLSIKSVFYPHCGPRRKHVLLPRWAPQSAKPDLGASGVSIP